MWSRLICFRQTFIIRRGFPQICIKRNFSDKELKRFYKNVTITIADGGGYEVNLDLRKLRTPQGTLFKAPNEALAIAVAHEWSSQGETIKRHNMHLTHLCNTVIDNPSGRDKSTLISATLEFLDTDTVCYWLDEPPELEELQKNEWGSLLHWLKDRYDVDLGVTTGIGVPHIPEATKNLFRQHLNSYSHWALLGYHQAVECVKSVVIATALVDRAIDVEKAVALSRLEQEFQTTKWGSVEWHHDLELMALRSRLAAACLFVHLTSEDSTVKTKTMLR